MSGEANRNSGETERVERALAAIERVMRIFVFERIVYLLGAGAGMGLLLYAVYQAIDEGTADAQFLGLVFGSGGLFAITGGAVLLLLNRSFSLLREVLLGQARARGEDA